MENNQETKKKRRFLIPIIGISLIAIATSVYYYREYARYITTDDARIDADNVSVSTKIMGRISRILVAEGDSVKSGQLLVELDSSDLMAQKRQSMAQRDQASAGLSQAVAKFNADKQSIKVQEVGLARAQEDLARAKEQLAGNVITREQFDHIQKNFESALAVLEAAKTQLLVSQAQIVNAQASIKTSGAQLGVVSTQLSNTSLYSPMNAVVAKRWMLPGDITQAGQSVLTLSAYEHYWVTVYLEETKLGMIYNGQEVLINIDAYPGVNFTGKVFFIASNTAGQFSLIPPSNASGNFTKVTQRVAIKCSIDKAEGYMDLSSFRFMAGMSVEVKIIKE
jgi:membrane fusion protein, multidrug efflux system